MPETGIGLFPDVGGSWYLSRMPDHIGAWLALTGARLKAADCELVGMITDYVESADLPELKARLVKDPAAVETLLTEFEAEAGRPPIAAHQDEIARAFAGDSVEAIVAALEGLDSDWAREQLAIIATKSPLSSKIALRQMRQGARAQTFAEVMAMEYRIAHRLAVSHDFLEGVRALIVDKDNQPRWDPPSLEAASEAMIDAIFAPLPSNLEWSPLP
jgi:enoyl-CoA hydratase